MTSSDSSMHFSPHTDSLVHNPYPFIPYIHRADSSSATSPENPIPDIASLARYWTEIDNDLTSLASTNPNRARAIRENRLGIAQFDYSRTAHWHDPENIDAFTDLPYLPDGGYGANEIRGHLLDLYLPHSAIERGGNSLPVYIDIHGGGFTYGYKELNRNFCTHLAQLGFAVFSLNYRPAPQTDLFGQLADIQAALHWIASHLNDWPLSSTNIALTGDSAGGALAWLTLLIENSVEAAQAFHIDTPSGLSFQAATLVSGVFNLAADSSTVHTMSQTLGTDFFITEPDAQPFLTPQTAVQQVSTIPPLLLTTSSDDFIQEQTLQLAAACASVGSIDFALDDYYVPSTQTLGHVYPVCLTWLPESQAILQKIKSFTYAHLQ